jgi:flavin reductase (DIM6/NTAB) family NADH-FMN oxidoreductase RutF
MSIGSEDFKKALQLWASGVAVVTSHSEKFGMRGMTVTSFASVSAEPPQILVCLNKSADTGENIIQSQKFAVNLLTTKQQNVSNDFSGGSSQEERFANTDWHMADTGIPILSDSLMSLECTVIERFSAGTHWIVIGEVQAKSCRTGDPLLYFKGNYRKIHIA